MNRDFPDLLFCKGCQIFFPPRSMRGGWCWDCAPNQRHPAPKIGPVRVKPRGKRKKVSLSGLIRRELQYTEWWAAVWERDQGKCVLCGDPGWHVDHNPSMASVLHAHGVTSVELALACLALWDPGGGRVLCLACHAKQPTTPAGLARYWLTRRVQPWHKGRG